MNRVFLMTPVTSSKNYEEYPTITESHPGGVLEGEV